MMGFRSLEDGSVVMWRLYSMGLVNRLFRLHILRRLCCSGPILCLFLLCVLRNRVGFSVSVLVSLCVLSVG